MTTIDDDPLAPWYELGGSAASRRFRDGRVAFLPGDWPTDDGEQASAYVTWWEPPDVLALTDEECDHLVAAKVHPRDMPDAEPWRAAHWDLFASDLGPVGQRLLSIASNANGLWWRLDVQGCTFGLKHYVAGKEHAAHTDLAVGQWRRKYVLAVQLSDPDDYEGGVFRLRVQGTWIDLPSARGTVAAFPGWIEHKVEPITAGERYSLVVNGYGPPLR